MRRREMLHLEDPDAEEEIMNLLLEGEIGIQLLDQEVIDRDIYWNVWKIVKSMKKDWRDVLILRVLEGLTAEEACAVLKTNQRYAVHVFTGQKQNCRSAC